MDDDVRQRLRTFLADRGIDMKEASRLGGLGETYVRDVIERGRGKVDLVERVVRAIDPSSVSFVMRGDEQRDGGTYRPAPTILGERDLPVYAAVEGGSGELVVSTDAIDWVARPWYLGAVREGYAVVVTGESMVPLYEPGDLVIVNPKLPAVPGKNAIFVAGEAQGEFTATVKRLLRVTASEWMVRQFNPPEGGKADFALPRKRWAKALRIVGKYEG